MSEMAEKIKSDLGQLCARERAELAHFLIQSLDDDVDVDGEAAWDRELARRSEEIDNGTAIGEPAEKVFAELRRKYS